MKVKVLGIFFTFNTGGGEKNYAYSLFMSIKSIQLGQLKKPSLTLKLHDNLALCYLCLYQTSLFFLEILPVCVKFYNELQAFVCSDDSVINREHLYFCVIRCFVVALFVVVLHVSFLKRLKTYNFFKEKLPSRWRGQLIARITVASSSFCIYYYNYAPVAVASG